MKQETFTDIEYSFRKKKTKREEFLEIMDEIIPWDEWVDVIKPYYPKGKRGRPPMGIEKMLRMYLLQIWFNLSDPATEDAIYDSYAMRKFTGIDFMTEAVPDETTLCKFRHLLEANGLNKLFFDAINRVMVQTGHYDEGRHHCGCHHHQCTQLHKERRKSPRSRNAPDHEGKRMAFWHEVSYRCGCRKRVSAYDYGYGSKCA